MKRLDLDELEELSAAISRIVDFDKSALEGRVVIRHGIEARLDELRSTYVNLPERLSQVAANIADKIRGTGKSTVKAINVVYFPQLGYLTAAPVVHQYELLGLFSDNPSDLWQVVFTTDRIVYFKNEWMRRLDEELGDVHADIVDCEIELFEQIKAGIGECRGVAEECFDLVTQID